MIPIMFALNAMSMLSNVQFVATLCGEHARGAHCVDMAAM